ncbi:pollen-specific leucine-rich repeat extensin-like protein 2 [Quillaja saponaria]|uniref:Pollen-specific leucine-rich repeat extensin-like protein 2 n=1 Tax=Quillaja saponaria TaxID=32244 RepID=A0AAD7PWV4_QUISA|nr:pollen-specific leucine-rich repeat extensin-like protein 2 [Quillaja saponaria]
MNTTPYMDKQIMDLTHGSSQSMDFIDLINHPKEEDDNDEDGAHHGSHQIGGNGIKKEDIAPSYDFQPMRPLGASTQFSNYDSTPNLGAYSRSWNPTDSKSNSTHTILNYGSLNSIEPTKDTVEKDRNVFDATIMSEIDRTVKKHTDNLLHVLEGVSARLTQMESRTQHLESSMDDLKVSIGNNHGSSDGKMRQLENVLREVQEGVQVIKDKQEIVEAQLKLAKLQVSKVDQQSETQSTVHMDPAQHAASAPLQSQQQLPPPANLPQSLPALHPPNSPPHPPYQSTPQQGLPPSVQLPVQSPPNQVPSVVPQREPYFPPRGQSQDTPNQQYQLPPSQQSHSSPGAPPLQQYQLAPQPQYSQPPTHPPQQQPSHPPVSLPQLQPSLSHHLEETSYGPSQNYPHSLRQLPSQPPSGPPTSQQFYGAPSHAYEPPSSRPGYVAPSGPPEPYHYGGSPQYGGTSPLKQPQLSSPAMATSGGSGYPQLPTARVLPHAVPTTSGVSGGSGSAGTGDRVPVDDVVDKVTSMGFPRDHVRATVRRLTENGQAVDLNIVLDKLMNDSEVQPPRGWFGR